jgi:hypothetical protein
MRAFLTLAFLLQFMPAALGADASIVGDWYEEVTYGGSRVISILRIRPDGSYTGVYRRCAQEGPVDTVSEGRWTYHSRRLRMTVQSRSGGPDVWDEYETESNDGRVWIYRGVAGNGFSQYGAVKFRDVRITPESKLPTCDTIS